jgi:hypothetical protein
MGGNLFSGNRRLSRWHYTQLELAVTDKLTSYNIPFSLIPHYKNKDNFGDLDVLVDFTNIGNRLAISDVTYRTLPSFFQQVFDSDKYYKNGNVHSIKYLDSQVDFINVPKDKFPINQFYFSYNDLNNLVGKLARRLNCKLGNAGLYYKHYTEDKYKKVEWFLSDNPRDIYTFLGLDYDKYLKGFDELEDIFKFVMSSDLFSSRIYETLAHKDRVRDKKRTTYVKFLDFIKTNVRYTNFTLPNNIPQYVDDYFHSDIEQKISVFEENQYRNKLLKDTFNGKLVSSITGLTDKELGAFMRSVTSKIRLFNIDLSTWTKEQVTYHIMKEFNNYVKNS